VVAGDAPEAFDFEDRNLSSMGPPQFFELEDKLSSEGRRLPTAFGD
jgi:hypothetical protein